MRPSTSVRLLGAAAPRGVLRLALLLALAAPLSAQVEVVPEVERTIVRGTVVDAISGTALENTVVRLLEERRGVLSDSLGRFGFADVPIGRHTVEVRQYGYEPVSAVIVVVVGLEPLDVALDPGPVALEGFTVVADRLALMNQRFESRRNAAPVSVQALDQTRLMRSGARNMIEFLREQSSIEPTPCSARGGSGACIWWRGSAIRPRIYVDEAPAIGGWDELATYSPSDLYLVEVYSQGGEIRAYTHNFMERMARRPMPLIPVDLWFGRED
jgi:hypothetical protein